MKTTDEVMELADAAATEMIHGHYHPFKEKREALRQAIEALAKDAAPAWMPIETVPTGTMILLANMDAMDVRAWCFVGWMVDGRVCGHRMGEPTHWMPLPKPPAIEAVQANQHGN